MSRIQTSLTDITDKEFVKSVVSCGFSAAVWSPPKVNLTDQLGQTDTAKNKPE